MSGFAADWLGLREPADAAARDLGLLKRLRTLDPGPGERRIVDLATGTGANLRYLAPRLGGRQHWLLVDRDAALLDALPERMASWAAAAGLGLRAEGPTLRLRGADLDCRFERCMLDLATGLESSVLAGRWLVTASALLDLVSEPWLRDLLEGCRRARAIVLFALSYDGRIGCRPPERDDSLVRELVNRHQRSDKGFGPALGPAAAARAAWCFARDGYHVVEAMSDWRLGPQQLHLQSALVEGWMAAAEAIAPAEHARLDAWGTRRQALIAAGESWVEVGHRDLLAWPLKG